MMFMFRSDTTSPDTLKLLDDAAKGNIHGVNALLTNNGIDINSKDSQGNTALHKAALFGQHKIVAFLLNHEKIQDNPENNKGQTPLGLASRENYTSIISLFIDRLDINIINEIEKANNPLIWACVYANLQLIEKLLKKDGIDVNICTDDGLLPLYLGLNHINERIVPLFLKHPGIKVATTTPYSRRIMLERQSTLSGKSVLKALKEEFYNTAMAASSEQLVELKDNYSGIPSIQETMCKYIIELASSKPKQQIEILKNAIQCDDSQKPSHAFSALMHEKGLLKTASPALTQINNIISDSKTHDYKSSTSYFWDTRDVLPKRPHEEPKDIARPY